MFHFIILILILFFQNSNVFAENCTHCTSNKMFWCPGTDICQTNNFCASAIKYPLNCPKLPSKDYLYDDNFARNTMMPIFAAVYTKNPQDCFDNVLPTLKFYKSTRVKCYKEGPETTCHAYTAYDTTKKSIVIAVEGTDGAVQMTEEVLSFFQEKVPFYENGRLFKYFNQAFFDLWNGGLETDFRALKYLYPDFQVWIAGHSLGAAIASITASYIVKFGLAQPENIKLITIGQPRVGDVQWAEWHDNTFPYSYRIVHHQDPVPHLPPMLGPDEVFHHRFEVWYNNKMDVSDSYVICKEADGMYCSNTQLDMNNQDHLTYFNRDIGVYGGSNCTKFW